MHESLLEQCGDLCQMGCEVRPFLYACRRYITITSFTYIQKKDWYWGVSHNIINKVITVFTSSTPILVQQLKAGIHSPLNDNYVGIIMGGVHRSGRWVVCFWQLVLVSEWSRPHACKRLASATPIFQRGIYDRCPTCIDGRYMWLGALPILVGEVSVSPTVSRNGYFGEHLGSVPCSITNSSSLHARYCFRGYCMVGMITRPQR